MTHNAAFLLSALHSGVVWMPAAHVLYVKGILLDCSHRLTHRALLVQAPCPGAFCKGQEPMAALPPGADKQIHRQRPARQVLSLAAMVAALHSLQGCNQQQSSVLDS